MKNLNLHGTEFTPEISFDAQSRIFSITGISRPEDVKECYSPALDWLRDFENEVLNRSSSKYDQRTLRLKFNMIYFNSASSKALLQILECFRKFLDDGYLVEVEWFYDEGDDQLREDAEDLSDAIEIPFKYLKN